jgi:adenylate cyclase
MQQAAVKLSVLVADVANEKIPETRLNTGNTKRFMGDLFKELSGIARINNGELHQTWEAGLMCAFMAAHDAVVAASTMHRIVETRLPPSWEAIKATGLCIRIDTGTVIRAGSQLFGDPVRRAILMKSLAKPCHTLISESTRRELTILQQNQTRFIGSLRSNASMSTVNVFDYIGNREEDTLAVEFPNTNPPASAMDITYGPIVLTVDELMPAVTFGRLTTNHLVLNYPRVSRNHGRFELRNGKLLLVDDSINGTYVRIGGLNMVCVKRDEMQLYGQGLICPGREAASSSPGAIHFITR